MRAERPTRVTVTTLIRVIRVGHLLVGVIGLGHGRRARGGRGGSASLILSVIEVVAGVALTVGVVVAVQGYAAFAPWRSPLLLPAVLCLAVGLGGVGTARRVSGGQECDPLDRDEQPAGQVDVRRG